MLAIYRSKVESNRGRALEEIIDLAITDAQLLEIFKALRAVDTIRNQEAYIWTYCSESLVLTSRTALACLQEKKVIKLVNECIKPDKFDDKVLIEFLRSV